MTKWQKFWLGAVVLAIAATLLLLSCTGCASSRTRVEKHPGQAQAEAFVQASREVAIRYAASHGLVLRTMEVPAVEICRDEDELVKRTNGERIPGKRLCGRCSYGKRTVYVVGMDLETLTHEMGHWWLGESEEKADAFEAYCVASSRQAEDGLRRMLNGNDRQDR